MEPSELENKEPETAPETEPVIEPANEPEAEPEFVLDTEPEKAPAEAKPGKFISVKSFVAILVAVCLVFGAVIGVISYRNKKAAEPEAPVEEQTGLDYAAMRAAHDDSEVVMTIDGSDVTWSEYFYWISYNATMIQNYVGAVDDWNVEFYDGLTYAEYVREASEESCRQYHTLETLAKDMKLTLTPEDIEEIAAQRAIDIAEYCGEGGTEEDFAAYLAELNMTPEIYDYINKTYQLYKSGYTQLYGEEGANCSADVIQSFLSDNGYMNANHILFMTIDTATGEELDEETIAGKLEQAQALVEELRAIEDTEELVARFAELKVEYCEDTGKVSFPDGYVFMPGEMVAEFENGVLALGDYEVSEPIKSSYGYHIILRLPLTAVTPDTVIDTQYGYTAKYVASISTYTELVQSYYDNGDVKYMPAFENFSIADIIK